MSNDTTVSTSKARKLHGDVEKAFRKAQEGDRVAYLTFDEQGGIFTVKERKGQRGIGGTIVLSLSRERDGQEMLSEIDMRKDGPEIAMMAVLPRVRKQYTKRAKAPAAPADAALPADSSV